MVHFAAASPARSFAEYIGPYRVLQVLGEGGTGIVYEAEEPAPVRRRVAVKVVRGGIDSDEVLARFDAERQALAVMDHPGIAKVLHAGTTAAGQPYFAMELVKGPALTEYCDAHRLTIRDRIGLVIDVCHAVQHAHQKGVIHRDLKPTNILVAEVDGRAQPKIIDFGIAKALGQQLSARAAVTVSGEALGTLGYMSPEQAGARGLDVDTRADVYSLGAILYELLVGRLPVDPTAVSVPVFLARLTHDDDPPPRPSDCLARLGAARQAVAHARRTDPERLRRVLQGDLDWIVLRAMDADRARRYETANFLAVELQRFLADEPVAARPPGTAYRLRKLLRRRRGAVAGGVTALVAVLAGATFATVGMVRATRAERRAAEEAAAARQVTDFLVDLFRVSDPGEARGNTITARELLDRGAQRIGRDLAAQPRLQARILRTVGSVYGALGLYAPARQLLSGALQVQTRIAGPGDTTTAGMLDALGSVASDHGDFADAEQFLRRALAVRVAVADDSAALVPSLRHLATLRVRQGRAAQAESIYRRVLAIEERGPESRAMANTLTGLAVVYWSEQRYAEVEPVLRRALAIQERTLGADHPNVAATLNNLGALYWTQRRYADALPLYQRTRAIFERTLGPDHPDLAATLSNLGETYWKLGRPADAEPLFRRALAIKEHALTPDHPAIAVTLNGLAGLLRDEGRFAEAEPLYRRALAIRERALGPTHPAVGETLRDLAALLRRTGRAPAAAALEARAARLR